MKGIFLFWLTVLGAFAQGPAVVPVTLYGTVRNLAGEIIDNPYFEQIAFFVDGVEVGRAPLEWVAESGENYRLNLTNASVFGTGTLSAKLIRDSQEVPLVETAAWLAYSPVQGQLTRFDFAEKADPGDGGSGGGPVTPSATIFGVVRNLAGEIMDNPGVEQLAIFADGSEIGRVPLELTAGGDENYRFEFPNVEVPDLRTYSVKLIRDGAELPLVESASWLVYEPVRGESERFDFVEQAIPGGGGSGGGPVAPQTTIYGTVRNLAGEAIDIPAFEQLAIFVDEVEIGRVPLEVNSVGDENYRFNIPGTVDLDAAVFSVKLIRDGQEVSLSGSGAWLVFEPVPGQLMRFDFVEESSTNDDDDLPNAYPGPSAPPTTIYGVVRNLAGEVIDNPLYEQLAFFADGVEIGRAPLKFIPEASENYRFQIPNFSVASRATHTVKLVRDGQMISVFDSCYGFRISRPIQGELRRLDFTEMSDLNQNGVPDAVEIEGGSIYGDFDFDGLKDFQEAAIGTDPRDPNSGINFKVVGELPNGDVEIAYDVVSGHSYTLEVSNDVFDWTEVSVYTATSDTRRTVTATPISGDSVFWRVGVK
jgi:hypothetical protein